MYTSAVIAHSPKTISKFMWPSKVYHCRL